MNKEMIKLGVLMNLYADYGCRILVRRPGSDIFNEVDTDVSDLYDSVETTEFKGLDKVQVLKVWSGDPERVKSVECNSPTYSGEGSRYIIHYESGEDEMILVEYAWFQEDQLYHISLGSNKESGRPVYIMTLESTSEKWAGESYEMVKDLTEWMNEMTIVKPGSMNPWTLIDEFKELERYYNSMVYLADDSPVRFVRPSTFNLRVQDGKLLINLPTGEISQIRYIHNHQELTGDLDGACGYGLELEDGSYIRLLRVNFGRPKSVGL